MLLPLAEVAANQNCDTCFELYENCMNPPKDGDDPGILLSNACKKRRNMCLDQFGCECEKQWANCGESCNFQIFGIPRCIASCIEEHAPQCPRPLCEARYAKIKVANANLILNAFGGSTEDAFVGLYENNNHHNAKFQIIPVGNNVIFKADKNQFAWDHQYTLHAFGGSKEGSYIRLHGDENYARKHANSLFELIPYNGKYIIKVSDQDLTMHAYGGSKSGNHIRLHNGVEYAKQHANSQFTFHCVD